MDKERALVSDAFLDKIFRAQNRSLADPCKPFHGLVPVRKAVIHVHHQGGIGKEIDDVQELLPGCFDASVGQNLVDDDGQCHRQKRDNGCEQVTMGPQGIEMFGYIRVRSRHGHDDFCVAGYQVDGAPGRQFFSFSMSPFDEERVGTRTLFFADHASIDPLEVGIVGMQIRKNIAPYDFGFVIKEYGTVLGEKIGGTIFSGSHGSEVSGDERLHVHGNVESDGAGRGVEGNGDVGKLERRGCQKGDRPALCRVFGRFAYVARGCW